MPSDMCHSISGVQIFSSGKWNGDDYSVEDLDEMVLAFNENQATLKPALKLGHDPDQKMLQRDGYPAAGWVSRLYRSGNKLLADFVDIPAKVYELIKRKAYKKVSAEIFWNLEVNGKHYKRMLSAVSMLGGDMPAVGNLDDMLALYGVTNSDSLAVYTNPDCGNNIKQYTLGESELGDQMPDNQKTENEIKLEADLEAQKVKMAEVEAQAKSAQDALAAKDQEIADLKKFKEEADAKAADLALDAEVDSVVKDGLASPAMKPYIKALLGVEKKEYALGDKTMGKAELVKELLKLHSVVESVNTEDKTNKIDPPKAEDKEKILDEKIRAYAAENKVSYGKAYAAVLKTENNKGE